MSGHPGPPVPPPKPASLAYNSPGHPLSTPQRPQPPGVSTPLLGHGMSNNMAASTPPSPALGPGYQLPPQARPVPAVPGKSQDADADGGGYQEPPIAQPVILDQPQLRTRELKRAKSIPPGLEYLTTVDQLFVKQKVELLEAILGCETQNKFKITDAEGKIFFTAQEVTKVCSRNLLGSLRPFELYLKDGKDKEIIHLSRPFACNSCLFPCFLQSVEVFSPPGTRVGTVEQERSWAIPQYLIKNEEGEIILRIKGPFCTFSICRNIEFKVLSADGLTEVGKISKKWAGLGREPFTDADNFGMSLPVDLDVKMKAVMIGACLLIDLLFYENK